MHSLSAKLSIKSQNWWSYGWNYLYFGDGLRHIFPILSDSILSKWLSQNRPETSPRTSWKNLLQLLEKEQRQKQQKSILLGPTSSATSSSKSSRTNDQQKDSKDPRIRFYISSSSPHCAISNAPDGTSDNVFTSIPNGSRIIQYYTCKKFADVTPANRLSLLKEKGYCYQCIYPRADASSGKHPEGSYMNLSVNTILMDTQYESMSSYVKSIKTVNPTKMSLRNSNVVAWEAQAYQHLPGTSTSRLSADATNQQHQQQPRMTIHKTMVSSFFKQLSSTTKNTPYSSTMVGQHHPNIQGTSWDASYTESIRWRWSWLHDRSDSTSSENGSPAQLRSCNLRISVCQLWRKRCHRRKTTCFTQIHQFF